MKEIEFFSYVHPSKDRAWWRIKIKQLEAFRRKFKKVEIEYLTSTALGSSGELETHLMAIVRYEKNSCHQDELPIPVYGFFKDF